MPFDASPRVARAARAVHPGRDRRRERVRAREEGVKPRGPRAYLSSISAAMAPPEARRAVAPRRDATTLSPTTGLRADPTPERVRAAAPAPRTPAPRPRARSAPRARDRARPRDACACARLAACGGAFACAPPSAPRRAATGERPFKITQSSCLETRGERARCDPTSYEPSKSPRRPFEKSVLDFPKTLTEEVFRARG